MSEHIYGIPNPTKISKHLHAAVPENLKILQRTKATKTAKAIALNKFPRKQNLLNENNQQVPIYLFFYFF